MLGILAFKQSMFSGVLDGGQDEVFLGGTRLARFLEGVEQATGAIPAAMPAGSEAVDGGASDGGASEDGAMDGAASDGPALDNEVPDGTATDDEGKGGAAMDDGASDGGAPDGGGAHWDAIESEEEVAEDAVAPIADTWAEVINAGASLLEKLGAALDSGRTRKSDQGGGQERDQERAQKGDRKGERGPSLPAGLVARDEKTGEPYLRVPVPKPETLRKIIDLLAGLSQRWSSALRASDRPCRETRRTASLESPRAGVHAVRGNRRHTALSGGPRRRNAAR